MSKKTPQRYTITAALPYANGPVHIGHLAGVYVPADIYARYLRSNGKEVLFVCGSDEHGVPITIRAKDEGVTPQQVVDKYHGIIDKAFKNFGVTFDVYSRTSSKVHYETASDFFNVLDSKNGFEEKLSEQYYDEEAKQFLADRYIKGTCPKCEYGEAYGDQCEKCGTTLSPTDLKNPVSMLSGNNPVRKETKHWYLPLDKYEDWLKEWILEGHKEWKPNVYGQCKSWIDSGLHPRAVTRDLSWGVPVPVKGGEGKVLYVWFDAPIGYISASKEWAQKTGKDWEPFWKDESTEMVHFIGKDNIVFHCIIFPAMLKAHGEFILPENVPANEFLNLEGDKISTSKNWAVWLHEYLEELPGKEDVLRYTLCANAPESKDNDFTWKDYQTRNNSELVAILGNFVNRAVVLTHKYFDGNIPNQGELFDLDKEVLNQLSNYPTIIGKSIEKYKFRDALGQMMELARMGNKYLADTEPWKLIKEDKDRVATILNVSLQLVANLTVLAEPFLPFTAQKIANMMNLDVSDLSWEDAGTSLLADGHKIKEASLLFEKIEDVDMEKQIQKLEDTKSANMGVENISSAKEGTSFDDFMKMDMRVATILHAEKVAKSSKLLKLKVATGLDERTVVSGIAKYHKPEDIIGKQVCLLANLAPRKIMGIESQGMILMAEGVDGTLEFIQPGADIMNGATIS